jgi:hypothetical protein
VNPQTLEALRERLADKLRMDAFRVAAERVCAERSICVLGSGLGELSLLALRAGAARVFALEEDPVLIELSQELHERHGYGASRFFPMLGRSHQVELPERVDVVMADPFAPIGVAADMHFALEDALHRFAKPGAIFVPESISRRVALARPRVFTRECEFWDADLYLRYGLDFGALLDIVRSRERRLKLRVDELASEWCPLPELVFADRKSHARRAEAVLEVTKPGTATGFCLAFEARLCEGVELRTLPGAPATHWDQGFVPFPTPLGCGEGDLVVVEILHASDFESGAELRTRVSLIPAPRAEAYRARRRTEDDGGIDADSAG